MSPLHPPLASRLKEPLDSRRVDAVWQRIEVRRRRSPNRFVVALPFFAAVCAVALLAVGLAHRATDATVSRSLASTNAAPSALTLANGASMSAIDADPALNARTLVLSDGTRIALGAGARMSARSSASAVELSLQSGRARFEVQPQRGRRFAVAAGALTVEVVGTAFSVERRGEGVEVSVEHGRVRVRGASSGETLLGAGESLHWPLSERRDDEAPSVARPTLGPPAPAFARPARPEIATPAAPWQAAAHDGDFAHAYALLSDPGYLRSVRDAKSIETLLALSDVARAAGHPRDAAAALERLLVLFPRDPRAGMAALTLGRTQLDALSDPCAGARSLQRALAIGLPVALREDALARSVQAYASCGQSGRAAAAAQVYHRQFPAGRFAASVDLWSGAR